MDITFTMLIADANGCDAIIEVSGTFFGQHYNASYDNPEDRMEFQLYRYRLIEGMTNAVPEDLFEQVDRYVDDNYYELSQLN